MSFEERIEQAEAARDRALADATAWVEPARTALQGELDAAAAELLPYAQAGNLRRTPYGPVKKAVMAQRHDVVGHSWLVDSQGGLFLDEDGAWRLGELRSLWTVSPGQSMSYWARQTVNFKDRRLGDNTYVWDSIGGFSADHFGPERFGRPVLATGISGHVHHHDGVWTCREFEYTPPKAAATPVNDPKQWWVWAPPTKPEPGRLEVVDHQGRTLFRDWLVSLFVEKR
ncbi:hypothetical protein [Phycicoccus duodecadis]|uniref:Uncharacterized protein n=1 Tax=Phycicoccus duodecadis TaxID=173053 RepID=A0A2N3YKB5_9MICO|nr:hypothetical protein [Phycicoccus duodecadis]PKW27297.1 hypothetical protein ATL31_2135 [Phycicoccus duodecadis]